MSTHDGPTGPRLDRWPKIPHAVVRAMYQLDRRHELRMVESFDLGRRMRVDVSYAGEPHAYSAECYSPREMMQAAWIVDQIAEVWRGAPERRRTELRTLAEAIRDIAGIWRQEAQR